MSDIDFDAHRNNPFSRQIDLDSLGRFIIPDWSKAHSDEVWLVEAGIPIISRQAAILAVYLVDARVQLAQLRRTR